MVAFETGELGAAQRPVPADQQQATSRIPATVAVSIDKRTWSIQPNVGGTVTDIERLKHEFLDKVV